MGRDGMRWLTVWVGGGIIQHLALPRVHQPCYSRLALVFGFVSAMVHCDHVEEMIYL